MQAGADLLGAIGGRDTGKGDLVLQPDLPADADKDEHHTERDEKDFDDFHVMPLSWTKG